MREKQDKMNCYKKNTILRLCLLAISFLCAELSPAQVTRHSKQLNASIAVKAKQLLQNNLPNFAPPASNASTTNLEALDKFLKTELFQTELLKDNWYSSRIDQLKHQTGLQLSANYQHNEYGALDENFENDSRFRVGLDFDLMENGLMERKAALKRFRKDQEIHQMESLMSSRERDYSYLYNCLIYNFNQEKISLLQQRIPFLEEYIHLLYQLYFAHEMSYDQIIDQKSRLKEAEIMLAAAHQFNAALEKEIGIENIALLSTAQLPVVQIEVERLLDPTEMDRYQQNVKRLKNERIDLSYRKRLEARLRVFARYNYGSYQTQDNERAFTSFGMSLRAPIQFNQKKSEELAGFEKAMVEEEISEVWYNRVKEIMILYEEYQYKLKQYSNFLHKTFRLEEKFRVEKVLIDSRRDVHSPMKAIRHIDNDQAVDYELLHLKQQLYLLLLKIHLRSYQKNFTSCLKPLDFSGERQKLLGQRFAQVGNLSDRQLNPQYLIKYLQKNEINQILLSGASQQIAQWAELLDAEGFDLYCAADLQNQMPSAVKTHFKGNFRRLDYSGQLLVSAIGTPGSNQLQLTTVPDRLFNNRNELERWIELEHQTSKVQNFLFEDISRIMELDKKNLGVE